MFADSLQPTAEWQQASIVGNPTNRMAKLVGAFKVHT
jgi:hypothetical protein